MTADRTAARLALLALTLALLAVDPFLRSAPAAQGAAVGSYAMAVINVGLAAQGSRRAPAAAPTRKA